MDNQNLNGNNQNLLNEFEKLQSEIENINKYFNQLIEKEQKMRLVLQNQQMLNAKHKYNQDQFSNKPLYQQMIGSSAPEKSNNTSHMLRPFDKDQDHPHDISNNQLLPPANPRNAGHSQQASQYSGNSQNISPNIQKTQQNINQNEEESKQNNPNQQMGQTQNYAGLANQQNQNEVHAHQGPQQTFGNDYQSQMDGASQYMQGGFQGNNQLDKTQKHITNQPSLSHEQLMLIQQQQQQQNQYPQEFYGWQVVNGALQVSNAEKAGQLVEQMFNSQQGQSILVSNQTVQKHLQDKEAAFKKQLQTQFSEIQTKFLKNNSSQELKNSIIQKDEEIKKLNQTINNLKEQVKEKTAEIELWKSKAINLNKTNQSGNNATLVYDQEIKKLSLVILNQQKEIEEWKSKALNGGIANNLDGNAHLPPASQASGSERIAQQRALLLYIEVERLKKIIEKYKEMADNNGNNLEGGNSNFNNAVNNAGFRKRGIFEDNKTIFKGNNNNNNINQSFSKMNNQNNQNNDDQDIQNLRRLLEKQIQEIDEWRMKFAKLAEKAQSERDQLEQEVYRLKEALSDAINNNGDHRGYRSQTQAFDSDKVNMLQNELQKVASALREKIAENEMLRNQQVNLNHTVKNTNMQVQQFAVDAQGKNQQLTGELGKVTNILKEKLKQNEELREYMSKLEQMIKDKQYENQQIVQRMQQMQAQMQDKQQFANKIQQYEHTIHNMRDEFERAQNIIKDKMKENETLKQNLQRVQSLQNHKEMIETEMRKFQQALEIKARECEEWRIRCKAIEQKLQSAAQIEARAKDSEYKLRNLMNEIAMLPQRISKI